MLWYLQLVVILQNQRTIMIQFLQMPFQAGEKSLQDKEREGNRYNEQNSRRDDHSDKHSGRK